MPEPLYHDPFAWFDAWFADASQQVAIDPNAMTLSTVAQSGQPSARVVLLKSWDDRGFVFYTNRQSRKGGQLAGSTAAALNFFWRDLSRQIRIEGHAEQVDDAESDAYFASRPRLSQLGAWASHQSQTLPDPDVFEARLAAVTEQFEGQDVPRPPHWGGYRVVPQLIEFWESGEYRLHERWEFQRVQDGWQTRMLYP